MRKWTYVPRWSGFVFLAIVLNVWSRRFAGWAVGEQMTSELVLAAPDMASKQRKPKGAIRHGDQGNGTRALASVSVARRPCASSRWEVSAMTVPSTPAEIVCHVGASRER
ncbi:MAG TPA: hypothetical protein VKV24_04225 [Casimicrobiaceae bacterium]|nr:hypothetical protein [Casimicrobiaceae bacterium]